MDWWKFEETCLNLDFDRKARPKTFEALYTVVKLIPEDMAHLLRDTLVYVPGIVYGEAFNLHPAYQKIVYLDEHIERLTQEKANHVVAHELAHVMLGHTNVNALAKTEWDDQPCEIEAIAFAEKLGFPRVYPSKRAKRQSCML